MKQPTVTQGPWAVGSTTGSNYAGAILSVCRHITLPSGRKVIAKGDSDGMVFPDSEAAHAYADERGYTQPFDRRVWCRNCRELHVKAWPGSHPRPEWFCPATGERVNA